MHAVEADHAVTKQEINSPECCPQRRKWWRFTLAVKVLEKVGGMVKPEKHGIEWNGKTQAFSRGKVWIESSLNGNEWMVKTSTANTR